MPNVLVLSAGRRVELVQGFQAAVGRHDPQVLVYAVDLHPERSAACHVADGRFSAPRVTDPAYMDFLWDLCHRHGIGLVVPTIDTELLTLAAARDRFAGAGIHLIISDTALVAACRDKRRTAAVFDALSIDQPRILDRAALEFPCFCKPYDGSCSIGARKLDSAAMLTEAILRDERNMFMEYVGPEYTEYTIDAYYDRNGAMRCLVPRERVEVRGGEVSKGITRKTYVYEYLRERLGNLRGARGCMTIQVFVDEGRKSIKALEINPRFGGGFPLSLAAGADYPDWLIREYLLGQSLDFFEDWEDQLMMLRYDAKVLVRLED